MAKNYDGFVFEEMMRAIGGQESNNNYKAQNKRTKAFGKYQIMPANWKAWTKEFGMEGAKQTPENQEIIARSKLKQYFKKYGLQGAIQAWYAGEGSFKYSDYALNRKQGKGDEPSINEYVASVLKKMHVSNYDNELTPIIQDWDSLKYYTYGFNEGEEKEEEKSTSEIFFDSMWNTVCDSPFGTYVRDAYTRFAYDGIDDPLTQEDNEAINTLLVDAPEYAKHLTTSGYTKAEAMALANRKAELIQEQKEMEQYNDDIINAVSMGKFVGDFVADPTIVIPVVGQLGRAYKIGKLMYNLGGVLPRNHTLIANTIRNMAEAEVGMGLQNYLDDEYKGNEKNAGDYLNDAGVTACGVLALNGLARGAPLALKSSYGQSVRNRITNVMNMALRNAGGLPTNPSVSSLNLWGGILRSLDQGAFAKLYNSPNQAVRALGTMLYKDARQRDVDFQGAYKGIKTEEVRKGIQDELEHTFEDYYTHRYAWMQAHRPRIGQFSYEDAYEFDRLVLQRYNQRFANHYQGVDLGADAEVERAVEVLHRTRQRQIEIAKRYGLADEQWQPIDLEHNRLVDPHRQHEWIQRVGGVARAEQLAYRYILRRAQASRDITRAKIERRQRLHNIRQGLPPNQNVGISDADLDTYIEQEAQRTAQAWVRGDFDMRRAQNIDNVEVGSFNPFRVRLAMDTSVREVVDDTTGETFCFDTDLRDFNLVENLERNFKRFSGETAFNYHVGGQAGYETMMQNIRDEYAQLVLSRQMTRRQADEEMAFIENTIREIRGMRGDDEGLTRWNGAVHILKDLTYTLRGVNMMWNQIGEVGGAIAYGGAGQLFRMFPCVGRYFERLKHKDTAQGLQEVANHLMAVEAHDNMFRKTYRKEYIHQVFDGSSRIDRHVQRFSDAVNKASKWTNRLNRIRKMSHSMLYGLHVETISQCIRRAQGDTTRLNDYIFSRKNLDAMGIDAQAEADLLDAIRRYVGRDAQGNPTGHIDIDRWKSEDLDSYHNFYTLVQRHCEKGIQTSYSIGGRNILKDSHPLFQLAFQFKDFNLRAVNGQTLRFVTHGDMEDYQAVALSVLTGALSYGSRMYFRYLLLKQMGFTTEAEEWYEKHCNPQELALNGVLRSSMLTGVASFLNDIKEITTGEGFTSNRTTVKRYTRTSHEDYDVGGWIGSAISQAPAYDVMRDILRGGHSTFNILTDEGEKKDWENLRDATPFMLFEPFLIGTDALIQRNLKY